ncbi:GTP-binding protein lepa [Heliocybe sulcata]|uniref:GTP-binding protein lepa n=1 Tax=Heliocybe sulcata TaxID=5364 RepID=A0A5C3NAI6_9AGAM|nr:GTP-binding protein lepa [Heliocybe sulcata]
MHPGWRDACLKVLLRGKNVQLTLLGDPCLVRPWQSSRGFHATATSRAPKVKAPAMEDFPSDLIRNFSIIAHIDHGKSTLADRLLELTGTIQKLRKGEQQMLDKLKVERERGITVKAQTASMFHNYMSKRYMLNLIDTPGHVDFSWEVARSLAACQGALLLVDASQGVQAQTLSVFHVAKERGLVIVPILNKGSKIDLPAADPELMAAQMHSTFGVDTSEILQISAKTGKGVESVLEAIIDRIPAPRSAMAEGDKRLKAFLFDSSYDRYRGVISLLSVQSGVMQRGDKIQSIATSKRYEVTDLGIMHPEEVPTTSLREGQVGWMVCSMKDSGEAHVGDTLHRVGETIEPMPGLKATKAMVYAGIFPVDSNDFVKLEESIKRLTLTDRSVTVSRESSSALGQGCRLGFLGTLHMDVFRQRLEDEYDANVIITAPTVPYKVIYKDREVYVSNPTNFPDVTNPTSQVKEVQEPVVNASIIVPEQFFGDMMDLLYNHRAEDMDFRYINVSAKDSRLILTAVMPLSEIVTDFFDKLKSRSSGFASFDYEDAGYKASNLAKIVFLVHNKPVDALALIVHRSAEQAVARTWVKKLQKVIPRQLFEVPIQAAVGKKIIARETLSAIRSDVTAGIYGGHYERKLKHIENQKESKKRMKRFGSVDLPQEAFFDILRS